MECVDLSVSYIFDQLDVRCVALHMECVDLSKYLSVKSLIVSSRTSYGVCGFKYYIRYIM